MLKAVLFDLDNTLIDFMRMKRESTIAALDAMLTAGLKMDRERGLEILSKLYDKHGMEYEWIFQQFLRMMQGGIDYRLLSTAILAYRKKRASIKPYAGVVLTLKTLRKRGLMLGIVTDAPRLKAWLRLTELGIAQYFKVVVTHEDASKGKPSMLPFKQALDALNVKPAEALFVGDNPEKDIEGARRVGMRTCWAKYGYDGKMMRSRADCTVERIRDVLRVVFKRA